MATSDFEEQMRELNMSRQSYVYKDCSYATEREMIRHLLDEFRCSENFAAEYLNRWIEVSDQEFVRGGLRAVQQRENYHAQVLEMRLRELGGIPQCTIPQERREETLAFYASPEKKDAQKLLSFAERHRDPAALLKPIMDVIKTLLVIALCHEETENSFQ